jgi:hypothetical protein
LPVLDAFVLAELPEAVELESVLVAVAAVLDCATDLAGVGVPETATD